MRQPVRDEALQIGQLARRASVSVDTIRFYERRGILPRPRRRPSGYRVYSATDVDRVRMTKALQKLGFTLDEVIRAQAAVDAGTATCAGERWRLETVVQRVDRKIDELVRLRAAVVQAFESCQAGQCPVLCDQTGTLGGFLERPATTPLGKAQLRQRDQTGTLGGWLAHGRGKAASLPWTARDLEPPATTPLGKAQLRRRGQRVSRSSR